LRGELGDRQRLFEQPPVDVRKHPQHIAQMLLAQFGLGVEHLEQLRQRGAGVGAIVVRVLDQVQKTVLGAEDAGVVREQTKQQPHQVKLQAVAGAATRRVHAVAVATQRVVQGAQQFDGADVERVLVAHAQRRRSRR